MKSVLVSYKQFESVPMHVCGFRPTVGVPDGQRVRRYVPASELAKVRSENRRLRNAVEWAMGFLYQNALINTYNELARRAGLRWDGKKWVRKEKTQ